MQIKLMYDNYSIYNDIILLVSNYHGLKMIIIISILFRIKCDRLTWIDCFWINALNIVNTSNHWNIITIYSILSLIQIHARMIFSIQQTKTVIIVYVLSNINKINDGKSNSIVILSILALVLNNIYDNSSFKKRTNGENECKYKQHRKKKKKTKGN